MKHGANKDELKKIQDMVAEGTSHEEISRVINISEVAIDKLVKSFGFKPAWVEQEEIAFVPSVVEKPKSKRSRKKRK